MKPKTLCVVRRPCLDWSITPLAEYAILAASVVGKRRTTARAVVRFVFHLGDKRDEAESRDLAQRWLTWAGVPTVAGISDLVTTTTEEG